MSSIKELYKRLCMTAVFRSVISSPLFRHFSEYALADTEDGKIRAYAALVACIYEGGGSLTECVSRLVFEDENVYVRAIAEGRATAPEIECSAERELAAFSEFASQCCEDFQRDMGIDYAAPFASEKISLSNLYRERMKNISKYGYGIFSSSPMFRLSDSGEIEAIVSADKTTLDSFIGYTGERRRVIDNTEAFIEGRPAANVLLCGDAGAGKSSTVKAICNRYFGEGVRLIELRKDQLCRLPYVMGRISGNPLKFIIFIDDLSFNQNDDNFSMLKAALEGSASAKSDNAVIYATSNRRHIVKESFSGRDGDDVHRNDTIQETLSLSERFGLVVLFSKPDKRLYLEIVHGLAERNKIEMDRDELDIKAEAFALRRGSRSARCAEQFIESLM